MKFKLTPAITFPKLNEELQKALANYRVELLKNPLLKFEYIQVTKSSWVGAWIRIIDKKEELAVVGCIPSTLARVLFGGLIVLLFLRPAHKRLQQEIKAVVENKFFTSELS